MTLFLNVNSEILAHVETGSRVLKHQVASMDIDLKNVAIECPLNQSGGRMIIEFAELYKEFGFNLSLDNCGVDDPYGHLISTLKPSYVKINPSFYSESSATDYSAKALESVVEMAERMGAVVVAQGVESEDDSIRLLTAGVHLQQGYYYTKDENDTSGDPAKVFFKKIVDTSERYKKVRRDLVRSKKMRLDATFRIMSTMCSKLSNMQESRFDAVCNLQVSSVDEIISMFVLNEHGQQVTSRPHITPRGPIKSAKALGTEKGADHAVRDYFMYLDMGYEKFVTQPFISPFTNEDACLISMPIYNTEGIRFVVCIEMPYPK